MDSRGKRELAKAYHEAGHAVVARTLGITLSYVTMLPTDDMPAGGALGNSASWLARDTDQATRLAAPTGPASRAPWAAPSCAPRTVPCACAATGSANVAINTIDTKNLVFMSRSIVDGNSNRLGLD